MGTPDEELELLELLLDELELELELDDELLELLELDELELDELDDPFPVSSGSPPQAASTIAQEAINKNLRILRPTPLL